MIGKRWKRGFLMVVVAVSILSLCGCRVVKGYKILFKGLGNSTQSSQSLADGTQSNRYDEIEEKLEILDQIIDQYYLNDEDIDLEALEEGIMKGYINALDEAYTTYYTAEEYASLMQDVAGEYQGVGMMVSQNIETKIITVLQVFAGSPAEEAGMKPGDIIYAVEGEDITGMDVSLVVQQIKGEAGTRVNVTVYRPDENDYIDLNMERRHIETPTVAHKMLEDQIGYIAISSFDDVTVNQFDEAINVLEAEGMEGLIIDLRNNPGGLLTAVCKMLDRILPGEQLLVYTIDKNGAREEMYSEDEDVLSVPIVVLVNGESASASEIFTAALQDYDKAEIVGETTFGKGIVQVIIPLEDGSAVKVTTSKYYTPNGGSIHEIGVTPDVVVEPDENSESDNQLQTATEVVKEQIAQY